MEFIQSKHVAAREIALAFGVPPMLLGIPGDNTYANYQEANRALWRLTLLPLIDRVVAALNGWLAPGFGPDLRLEADKDAIPALAAEREAVWTRIGQAPFLTPNEKRAELGFAPIDGGDELVAPVPLGLGGLPGGPPGNFKSGRAAEAHAALPLETKDRAAALARFRELTLTALKAKSEGKTHKVWRIVKDGKTREAHRVMEGVTVPIDEDFTVAGERLRLPSDVARGSPGNTFNCRCSVSYLTLAQATTVPPSKPAPISRGPNAVLTDTEIANIVFNETVSFSGPDLKGARKAIVHAIINGDEKFGASRPATAGKTVRRKLGSIVLPNGNVINEAAVLADIRNDIVPDVRKDRLNGFDDAGGNLFFGFRDANNTQDFPNGVADVLTKPRVFTNKVTGQVTGRQQVFSAFGPFENSNPNPTQKLGPTDNYLVIFVGKTK